MTFCTAINCMDGRVQLPVIRFLQERFNAVYVDSITEPGPIRILAEQTDTDRINAICHRLDISVNRHRSIGLALVGHHDCEGNPADRKTQETQLKASTAYLRSRYPELAIIELWVDENWHVSEVSG